MGSKCCSKPELENEAKEEAHKEREEYVFRYTIPLCTLANHVKSMSVHTAKVPGKVPATVCTVYPRDTGRFLSSSIDNCSSPLSQEREANCVVPRNPHTKNNASLELPMLTSFQMAAAIPTVGLNGQTLESYNVRLRNDCRGSRGVHRKPTHKHSHNSLKGTKRTNVCMPLNGETSLYKGKRRNHRRDNKVETGKVLTASRDRRKDPHEDKAKRVIANTKDNQPAEIHVL